MGEEMQQNNNTKHVLYADVGSCYSHGWRQMWKYFLELLLIAIISLIISIGTSGFSIIEELGGLAVYFMTIYSIAFVVFLQWPIEYGIAYASLRASRGEKLEVKNMFEVFKNYLNAVLANILVALIVGIGIVFLIIPGIIFACKLAFVPYLIVDKKMEAVEAIKTSWRMTSGHALTIFLIGFLAIFIALAGLICLIVGIIVAIIWIRLAFASIYYVVSMSKDGENTIQV
jgi:hypothetical protein